MSETTRIQAPIAPIHQHMRTVHDTTFIDEYEWLRDKESQETIAYLEAENAFTEQETAGLSQLRDNIYQEIKSRVKETDMSVPQRSGDFWYYGRSEEGKSYGYSCRIPVVEGQDAWVPPVIPEGEPVAQEQVILDLNELAEGHEFFSLGASTITTSGRYLAYSVDTAGDERFTLRIKDLETGELLDDVLEDLFYGATWAGEEYLFYQRVDDAWRPDSVWRHKIGTDPSEDVRVFHEADEHFNTGIGATRSEKYLIIASVSKITSEVWVLDMDNPEGEFRCIIPRKSGVEYDVDHGVVAGEDVWIVTHNATGPNFEIGWAPVSEPLTLSDLTTLMPHRDDVRIEGVDTYRDQIVVGYRAGAIGRAAIMQLTDQGFGTFEELQFDEDLYTVGVAGNPEWDAPVLRVGYTSFTTPSQVFDYTVADGSKRLLKQQEVVGGYNRDDYVATRLWVAAEDGAQIPVSLVHRADLDVTTANPTLLYGYGSYEVSMDPEFSIARLSLMDRGMIFAIAHIRGGGEMGRGWYDNGKMLCKKNTFTDFIAVADFLIARGVTTPEQMVAEGGSAGGMLMGAVANLAGDRFKAIEAVVPFVDPLTSMLMPELPLTVTEWDEWGDPLHDKEVYDYMASYAPYENVEAKAYPNILALTSINDTRVLYVEPAKWIARLRATAKSGDFLLKTEMAAGHGGVSGRYEKWKQTAFEYAWLINQATGVLE
ncbi:protease 2 [Corynebacterium ulcerans]|uniref:S9 family peptidase n=1 Tax=Corynebacterium ulcerans TaxID=65058 RepID=UPI000628553D|nr:S9 family peptidase [Corynebacterium ulcerans]KKO84864.1 protease 2 [Corynebacterium ulcerans]KKO86943.1 protease 2 [Corynebacterium ulcerans]KPJ23722.1 protease 2 [Corynebacterium ulcerans]OAG70344.1 protease 2 [Corynebacterium ulcerans]BDV26631.1 protease [Corynebacterium ulcerans]